MWYRLLANFAHVYVSIARPKAHVCGRNRLLTSNYVQSHPARDQNIPSPPPYTQTIIIAQRGDPGYEARDYAYKIRIAHCHPVDYVQSIKLIIPFIHLLHVGFSDVDIAVMIYSEVY